jgi:hypothetical protein
MLVRYRPSTGITLADFKADLDGILQGTITQVSQLSTNAKTSSLIYGTYPTGKYQRVNGTSYTYSKAHNAIAGYTHYFRLNFGSTQLDSLTIASGYTSGTDTLLNSWVINQNILPIPYTALNSMSIDIIINDKMFCIFTASSSYAGGVIDMGHSGVTRAYTSSMLMGHFHFSSQLAWNIATYQTQNPIFKSQYGGAIPYTYNLDTMSYGSAVYGLTTTIPYKRIATPAGNTLIIENPVFADTVTGGYATQLLYGVYKIATNAIGSLSVYTDPGNQLYRYTYNDFSFLVD